MLRTKHNPLLSLALLLAAYSTFSYFLFQDTETWVVWAIAAGVALSQALLLTTLFAGVREFIRTWLESDIGYFSLVALGAFSIALALVWFHLFEYVLLIVGTEVLARLDLQNNGCNQWMALLILTLVSFSGLGLGWLINEALTNGY